MDLEGRRRSTHFEDRGAGAGGGDGGGGGGLPLQALSSLFRLFGPKGTLAIAAVAGIGYWILPSSLKQNLLAALTGGQGASSPAGAGKVCEASPVHAKACDFSRGVLASTEDVWAEQFGKQALPSYGAAPQGYPAPTLVVFSRAVSTGGCGNATSAVGPFYCPADRKLYIDPGFYDVMERQLKAPGDFAQAYVIAHEVGHHIQNLIGSTSLKVRGETANQISVRIELQADCLAGVWGHSARSSLAITDEDLKEAVNAAHAIGDDTLGHAHSDDYTHGTSAQRIRWFRRGFENGDARQCDTLAVQPYDKL